MVRSRLPLPFFLRFSGPLLMLFTELLLGTPEGFSDLPVTDPRVQEALAFTIKQYNQRRRNEANYFKVLRVLKAPSQVDPRDEYDFTVEVVKTTCKKWGYWALGFARIQMCQQLPGDQEKRTCYFKVILRSPPNLAVTACT